MHNLFLNAVEHHVRDFWGVHEEETHGRKGLRPHSPAEQEENLRNCASAITHRNLSALKKFRRTYLEVFAKENEVELTSQELASVPRLAAALLAWFSKLPEGSVLRVPRPHSEPAKDLLKAASPEHILDEYVIGQLREDMEKITVPGADHWRMLFTINFVITLVRLWGGPKANKMKQGLLHNFIHLVAVVRFATSRKITEAQINIVETELQAYFRTLAKFPHTLYPSHHMSFHIPECLRRFGPAHGWWSFPFERYNGIIQRFNNNGKFDLKAAFSRSFGKAFQGSLLTELLSLDSENMAIAEPATWDDGDDGERLDKFLFEALAAHLNEDRPPCYATAVQVDSSGSVLLNPLVQWRSFIQAKGVMFASKEFSYRNSLILFQPLPGTTQRAGQIQKIFAHKRPKSLGGEHLTEFFYVVQEYLELSEEEAVLDPYRKFPLIDTQLYRQELSSKIYVVRARDILCHYASFPFKLDGLARDYQVVLSLNRVCAPVQIV
ncbi:hypothetical protein NLJ89_g9883 [Agrocybe chaxingu]|uniref:DUF4218 domain-containing protein n=1 Tax=Agrocybe chaxingu TaxID=84603 RepID=A0A9W8JZ69_9AGAR|nr:hypothetical protein NLJ89_g9883 [Agrocybe chaxingu]